MVFLPTVRFELTVLKDTAPNMVTRPVSNHISSEPTSDSVSITQLHADIFPHVNPGIYAIGLCPSIL